MSTLQTFYLYEYRPGKWRVLYNLVLATRQLEHGRRVVQLDITNETILVQELKLPDY